ncbi:collagen alpha-1(I) chain-like [Mauremys mutica]|uniref:collagen alpha-1(I) chain-like n=1 Tax=Mauremys mutica TaxID=74926 RepID=UPI001D160CA2|nr:collagen alpha-1(I) chain-like [Mauremys mutica]
MVPGPGEAALAGAPGCGGGEGQDSALKEARQGYEGRTYSTLVTAPPGGEPGPRRLRRRSAPWREPGPRRLRRRSAPWREPGPQGPSRGWVRGRGPSRPSTAPDPVAWQPPPHCEAGPRGLPLRLPWAEPAPARPRCPRPGPAAMSACHWEARRRQLVLERRRRNQLLQQKAEEAAKAAPEQRPEISPPQQQPQGPLRPEVTCSCQCCPCQCHYVMISSAKLPRRFSAVQYIQQW